MANTSKSAHRSHVTQSQSRRGGAQGWQHNPQDFTERCGTKSATRQEILRKNWDYLPPSLRALANRLSTSFVTKNGAMEIDSKTGQFALNLA